MPRPLNTRDEDPEVALVVWKLKESQANVARIEEHRQAARSQRRQAAVEAFAAGISWRRIAEYGGYGSAQAAQQDVASESSSTRRTSDLRRNRSRHPLHLSTPTGDPPLGAVQAPQGTLFQANVLEPTQRFVE
jgi:hypothetical protein